MDADTSDDDRKAQIALELERAEERAMWSAQAQFEQAKQWRAVNLGFGLPASVLAAISGATALAATAGRFVAGVLALVAAGLGAALTTLNAAQRAHRATSAANEYLAIQTAARQIRLIDLPYLAPDALRAWLDSLTARLDEQNKSAEPPNRWAFRKAASNIESGGQTYEADKRHGSPQEGA